jgi:putative transposase
VREKPIAQIAKDLGVAESGLRRWLAQADIDEGKREGLSSAAQGARRAAPAEAGPRDGSGDPQARERLLRSGERPPKMIFPVVRELAADGIPVTTACRVLEVSTSGFYEWDTRPASDRAWDQAHLMHAIGEAHAASYGTYGHRRVHAELVLSQHLVVSHGRSNA